jgi:flagellar assembly protein FliH
MSNPFAGAQRCGVWTQPDVAAPAPFVAWGAALRQAFEVPPEEMVFEEPEEPAIDIDAIRAEAMAQGFTAGIEAGRREADTERDALRTLAAGLDHLRPEPTQGLGAMIAATVERLLHEVVGEVAVDLDTLVARATAAAAMIGEETRPSILKLNPEDLKRLAGVDLPVAAVPDATLAPGSLRLETSAGSIEDGPAVRLDRLKLALDRIAGTR